MSAQELTSPIQPMESRIPRGFSFRLALPLGQLVLCAVLLLPIRGHIFYELGLRRLAEPSLPFQLGGPLLQPFAEWSLHNGMEAVAALNLPAGLVQLPYAIFSQGHSELTPAGIDFHIWRAVTWPIIGVIFWWIAGRGIEALVAARRRTLSPRIGWAETIMACGILAVCGTIAVVFPFIGNDRSDGSLQVFDAGAVLWTVFSAVTVAARIVQWRVNKKLSAVAPDL
jgi:hypothetical protein